MEDPRASRPQSQARRPPPSPPTKRTLERHLFYVLRGGCAWRLLPHDFLPWQTAYHYFRAWRMDGTWERIHATLRERLRRLLGREPTPPAQRSSTPRRPRLPRRVDCAATTVARRSAVESGICSSTRKAW